MYAAALASLRPAPTDTCPLWLNMASVAALPTQCSRHNTPSRAHALTKLIKGCLTGRKEFIVVCPCSLYLYFACLFIFQFSGCNQKAKKKTTVY